MSDPVADLKHELLAAADRRHLRRHPRRKRVLLTSATVSIAAAVALLVTASWSNSPSFLERAEAALAEDAGVLHAKWEDATTSTNLPCSVERAPTEVWIDLTPPYRYRAFVHGFPSDPASLPPAVPTCVAGPPTELGGTFEPLQTFTFEPPNVLRVSPLLFKLPPDPVVEFRDALSEDRAHDEGDTELAGRTVRRIRVDPLPCPDRNCPREPGYVFVDPETFHPVEIRGPAGAAGQTVQIVTRYVTYEYLPRTPENVALTDIRAQHPLATVGESRMPAS